MKRKIFICALMIVALVCALAVTASAANNVIKLDTLPTLEQIHANPSAYVSRLDEFETGETYQTYREKDANSVVVMFDKAETPTYYVFPAYYLIRSDHYSISATISKLNETIATADSTAFSGYASSGGNYGKGECDYLVRVEVPTYVTTITDSYKFEGSVNLKEVYFPIHTVIDAETGLEKTVAYITTITGTNLANSCSSLEYMHNSEYLPAGIINGNGFYGCKALKEFKIPETVTYISQGVFYQCSSLKEIVIPNAVTGIGKIAFAHCTSLETVRFGENFYGFYSPNRDYETFLYDSKIKFVYLPDNNYTFTANDGATTAKNIFAQGTNVTFFFTGNAEKAQALKDVFTAKTANENVSNAVLVEYDPTVDYTTYAKDVLKKNIIVYNYNHCDAFYEGNHNMGEVNSCYQDAKCQREKCGLAVKSTFTEHTLNKTFVYANGFDNAGVYVCYCENASYCTVANANEKTAPIVTFKGYSVPETPGVKGINAGFKIDKALLADYNEINDVDASLTLFMVNSANIEKILDGETLELASGVKGINVKISSTSYTDIGIAVKGFDATTEAGNYYTLNLITAIAVKTGDGIHYVQAGLKTVANTTQSVGGVIFNTVSADKVYSAVAQ